MQNAVARFIGSQIDKETGKKWSAVQIVDFVEEALSIDRGAAWWKVPGTDVNVRHLPGLVES